MSRIAALAVMFVAVAAPGQAQDAAAPDAGVTPLMLFLRVANRIGQTTTEFGTTWPRPIARGTGRTELRVTAGDRLTVHFDNADPVRATTVHVETVQLWRDLPDTASLQRAVLETQVELTLRYGPPSQCSDPIGNPSHLYTPQRVSRVWDRGPKGTPLRMSWSVSPEGRLDLQLYAGPAAADGEITLRCDAVLR